MNMVLKALFVDFRQIFNVMAIQSRRDINPGVDEGDFMTGQSIALLPPLLVRCIFI
jgi:hypothetical protein